MWYYSKDKKQIGPISDVAVANLFSSGEINKDTAVWTPGLKKWVRLEDSEIYVSISSQKQSKYLISLTNTTYLFRAMLISLFVFLLYWFSFLSDALKTYKEYISIENPLGELDLKITCIENGILNNIFGNFLILFFLATAYVGYRWVWIVCNNSRAFSKKYNYNPTSAALSFVVPILNLLAPYAIAWKTLEAASNVQRREIKMADVAITFVWGFFWLAAVILFFASAYMIPRKCMPEMIEPFYFTRMYISVVFMAAVLMTIILASRVFSLQKRYLERHPDL